ncbi:25720_t:CDS:1, partial [Racocetra persica]
KTPGKKKSSSSQVQTKKEQKIKATNSNNEFISILSKRKRLNYISEEKEQS